MILGIGIDVIAVERVRRQLTEQAGLTDRLFTSKEIADCGVRSDAPGQFACRFAAKEALLKALGTGWRGGIQFTDIEVTGNPPSVTVLGKTGRACTERGVRRTHLSMSRTTTTASAIVILER